MAENSDYFIRHEAQVDIFKQIFMAYLIVDTSHFHEPIGINLLRTFVHAFKSKTRISDFIVLL